MRIGIISDTHGHIANSLAAVRLLEQFDDIKAVLHCGDIGTIEIPPLFAAWPTHFVFGNCDYDEDALREAIRKVPGHVCHERKGSLELADRRIGLIHSDDRWTFLEMARCNRFDLVCYGHTHIAKEERVGRTLVLNPGALYRATPHTLALVDLVTMTTERLTCV